LLLHPQSGAHGLNLQRGGRHVVFFDIPWSYELFYQFYRRLARQGQTLLVVIHMLITSGSIDEQVSECLRNKGDMQELLFRIIKRLRLKFRS
jgi:SNF2 family DNA or RNA helicase